jgi:predicted RNA-binding Zn ribbon-like protein
MRSGELRDGFKFRSDHLALDLAATVAGRLKQVPNDMLAAPADLDRWLVAAGLTPSAPHATDDDLRRARELREGLFRLGRSCVEGRPYVARDIAAVNRAAQRSPPTPRLTAEGVTWRWDGVSDLLSVIARAGIELFGGDQADRIRACHGAGCSILFLDLSRGGDRRWCSMAACGNRAKLAEFRKRGRSSG